MGVDVAGGVETTCFAEAQPNGNMTITRFRKRYSSPPPAGVEPDPDYVPEVGEWFWWWFSGSEDWGRLQRRADGVYQENGEKRGGCDNYRARKAVPAVAPD